MQEEKTSIAFSIQSTVFDELDKKNPILTYMRNVVRQQVLSVVKPGVKMLELNAGTGLDAVFFAEHGLQVHATDNATGMIEQINQKINSLELNSPLSFGEGLGVRTKLKATKCSFENLEILSGNKYDIIFSNFGGLNCTDKLGDVIKQFAPILNPNAHVVLVIMPPVCPWEMLFALKLNFKLAFRRFNKNGAESNVEGVQFKSWYYSPKQVVKFFGNNYEVVSIQSLGLFYPPPYLEYFPKKFPRLFSVLTKMDEIFGNKFPFKNWGDHFVLTMRLK